MPEVTVELKKIAVFVEGLTEQMFVTKLFEEVLCKEKLSVVNTKMTGGSSCPVNITIIRTDPTDVNTEYYVLIVDCSGDGSVKSYILDQRPTIINAGYSIILGLLDLFPNSVSDLHNINYGLLYGVPQTPIPIEFTISIMEIETWFIGESSHFPKIDSALTSETISRHLGYDPASHDVESIIHPSHDLNSIYQIVGKNYLKKRTSLQLTIDALDFGEIYFELPSRIPSLASFIEKVNKALEM